MRFPRLLAVVAAVAVLASVVGCGRVDDGRDLPSVVSEAGGPRRIDLDGALRYVALGDSFSAGDGLRPYDDPACDRSPRAYPNLAVFEGEVELTSLACSAAMVPQVREQAAAAGLGADVGLVTVTVGGNDAGFLQFFTACALQPGCFAAPYEQFPTLEAWAQARLEVVGPSVVHLLETLVTSTPSARVVILGYPQLLPETLADGPGCALLAGALDPTEVAGLRRSTAALNEVLAAAAATAGATFVDVAGRFAGHEPCAPGEPWLTFGTLEQLLGTPEGVLHPNDAGQRAYAEALTDALT